MEIEAAEHGLPVERSVLAMETQIFASATGHPHQRPAVPKGTFHIDAFEIAISQTPRFAAGRSVWHSTAAEGDAILRKQLDKAFDIGALGKLPETLEIEVSGTDQNAPVDHIAQTDWLVEEDGMMFDMLGEEERLVVGGEGVELRVEQRKASAAIPLGVVVVIEQIVVALERYPLEREGGMSAVVTIDADMQRFDEVAKPIGIGAGVEVIVATFAVEGHRIATRQGAALDHHYRQRQTLIHHLGKVDERLLAPTIVVFDGLRHGSEMEEDATQRPLRFGEELHSVVEQRRDGLTPRGVKGRLLNGRCLLFLLSTSCRLLR